MRYRKLRIAWSVFWGLAAVLLIALWVRSYSKRDVLCWGGVPNGKDSRIFMSNLGSIITTFYFPPDTSNVGAWYFTDSLTPKPARKPKVVEVVEPEPETTTTSRQHTELRREIHSAIEGAKPLTIKQVNERFGDYGLYRVARQLLRNDYQIESAPAPAKGLHFNDRDGALAYAKKILSTLPNGKIKVLKAFRTRGA